MRGYCLIAMILAAGCYSPSVPSDIPCSQNGECPSGQTCVAMTCSSPESRPGGDGTSGIDAGIPTAGDRDGDGVADNVDNCPDVQNADQADEDGDKIGDACDLCPQVADTGTDADADKVGDACDPNPTLKDTVWVFDGFPALPTWSRSTNWTAPTPGIIQTVAAGDKDTDGEYMVPQFTPTSTTIDNFSITAVVKVTAEAGSNGDHSTGVEIYDATSKKGVDCALDHDPAGANATMYVQEFNNNGSTSNGQTQTYGWAMNLEYRLTLSRHGTAYKCVASTLDGKTTMTATTTSATVPRDGTALEIWAYGATVQYDSVEVVGAP